MPRVLNYFVISFILWSCGEVRLHALKELPADLQKINILVNDYTFAGYILFRKTEKPGAMLMVNDIGEVVWLQTADTELLRVFKPYKDSYVALVSKEELVEISYSGDTLGHLRYGENEFDRKMHHELIKDKDNNFVAITHEHLIGDLTSIGGHKQDTMMFDGIIKLSRDGRKLFSWKLSDHVDLFDVQDVYKHKLDWGHANSLEIDLQGNYLISFRDFDQIWKIDSNTGQVIWKFGSNTVNREGDRFYGQHAISVTEGGDILFFDNGHFRKRKSSRAISFRESEGILENKLIIQLPDSLFSWKMSSVYQFEDDRFLFNCTMNNTILITDSRGEVLWMAKTDQELYRAYYIAPTALTRLF